MNQQKDKLRRSKSRLIIAEFAVGQGKVAISFPDGNWKAEPTKKLIVSSIFILNIIINIQLYVPIELVSC